MAERFTLSEIRERTYKERDAWWTVLLVDPLAARLVQLVAPLKWVTPNLITTGAFLVGLVSAWFFWLGDYKWLLAGAIVFHFSFVLDCMDGKIARLKGTGSLMGAWFDYVFDRLRVLVCAVALMVGQYAKTDNFAYLWLAGAVIFLDMFRYLNALQMGKVKGEMRRRLEDARAAAAPFGAPVPAPVVVPTEATENLSPAEIEFRRKHGLFTKVRNALVKRRIRAHLFSGIEFQMFVFIVGPITNLILPVTILAGVGMLAFELLLIYKLLSSTKVFDREMAKIAATMPPAAAAATAAAASADLPDVVAGVGVDDEDEDTAVFPTVAAGH